MESHSNQIRFLQAVTTAGVLLACLGTRPQAEPFQDQVQAGVDATLTKEAFVENIEAIRQTESVRDIATATPSPTPTEEVIPTSTITLTPTPEHQDVPGSPSSVHMFITDLVTVDLAEEKTAVGDNYSWGRLERPYTAETMEYRDYLDIYQASLLESGLWIYVEIILIGSLPDEGDVNYSVELDVDQDGRGDFLVTAVLPPDGPWTTDGVAVYADSDEDIGGLYPMYLEGPVEGQNGYEATLFENGAGQDRDLAWVRRSPGEDNQLQLAFKTNLVGSLGFLWSVWTDEGLRDPGLFDINDHISFDEAGSPNKSNYRYPLKAVALVDSTCRAWYGFVPGGLEPGLCFTEEQVVKGQAGYGWCIPDPIYAGCGNNPCLDKCPGNRFCIPCRQP